MKKLLEIQEVLFCSSDEVLLHIQNLSFFSGISVFLSGTNASGKTLLLKAIAKQIKYKGRINRKEKVEVVFNSPLFLANSVEDELKYLLLEDEQKKFVSSFFKEKELVQNPNQINEEHKKLLQLCKAFLNKPSIVFIDEALSFLSKENQAIIFSYAKDAQITLVSVSKNIEEAMDYDYMIVLDKGRIAIEGKTMQVLQEEKLLKRLGIGLPFYVDLSIQLKLYGLIDKIYTTKKELVEALWK